MLPRTIVEDEENFSITRKSLADSRATPLQNLAQLISPELRQRFIRKLFAGDSARLDEFLATIEATPSWAGAYRWIQEHLARHRINPYWEEASLLSDLIYKRYFPQDRYV